LLKQGFKEIKLVKLWISRAEIRWMYAGFFVSSFTVLWSHYIFIDPRSDEVCFVPGSLICLTSAQRLSTPLAIRFIRQQNVFIVIPLLHRVSSTSFLCFQLHTIKSKAKYRFHAVAMLFLALKNVKILYLCKICCHISFQKPASCGASVAYHLTSSSSCSRHVVVVTAVIKNSLQWNNVHIFILSCLVPELQKSPSPGLESVTLFGLFTFLKSPGFKASASRVWGKLVHPFSSYKRTYIHKHTHTHTHTYMHTYMHAYVRTYIHTRIYVYTHT
jgi:hypothetical protein